MATKALDDLQYKTRNRVQSDRFGNPVSMNKAIVNDLTPMIWYLNDPAIIAGIYYLNKYVRYDRPHDEDSVENIGFFELIHHFSWTSYIQFKFRYGERFFERNNPDYNSTGINAIYRKQFEFFSYEIDTGYQTRKFQGGQMEDIEIAECRAAFMYQIPSPPDPMPRSHFPRSYLLCVAERGLDDSGNESEYFKNLGFHLKAGHMLIEKIALDFGADFQICDYLTFSGLTPEGDKTLRKDEIFGFSGRVGYTVTDWANLSFKAGYEERDSNIGGYDYKKKYCMVEIELSYEYISRKYTGILFEPDRRLDLFILDVKRFPFRKMNDAQPKQGYPMKRHSEKPKKFFGNLTFLFAIVIAPLICLPFFISLSFAQNRPYKIGPSDILSLEVFAGGEQQLEVRLTVSDRGLINAPFIGHIKAEGLTVAQLETLIADPLSKEFFVNPDVIVNILEYHSLRYFISGPVRNPGLYEMNSEISLMELIAKAGGTLPERGNVAYIFRGAMENIDKGQNPEILLSENKPFQKADLTKLLDLGDVSANVILKSGDVVFIPPKKKLNADESMVYVGGQVKKPDFYEFQPGLTALNACIMAGGFDRFAAPNRTRIIRKENGKDVTIEINLKKVMSGKIPDVELKSGDRVHVPETWL